MFVVKELAADSVFVVHVQELSLLHLDFLKDALAAVDLLLGGCDSLAEVGGYRLADFLAFGLAEWHASVVVLDGSLHEVDWLVALWAFAALVARADEVFVDAAVAFVAGVDQATAAGAAADRTLEVVLVLAVALPGVAVRFQYSLDFVEYLLADERLVPAGIMLATVGDDAGVVGAGEQFVNGRQAQRLWAVAAIPARA